MSKIQAKIAAYIKDQTAVAITKVRKGREFLLPTWYLRNGTINATESELENASESCELWSKWCAWLVVVSVALESLIAFIEPPYDWFLKLSVPVDVGVALGIVGEVLLGMRNNRIQTELRSRSNEKLGEAEAAAAAAQLELAKYRAPRRVSSEDMTRITETLKSLPSFKFDVCVSAGDEEFFSLLDQIVLICLWADWEWVDWPFSDGVMRGQHKIGTSNTALNVVVSFSPRAVQTGIPKIAEALADGLIAAGVIAHARLSTVAFAAPPDDDIMHIRIGRKT